MRLDPKRVDAFLRDPGACRVVLLHGEDEGLVRERADALTRTVAGSLDDPFRVARLAAGGAGGAGGLEEEATALSLIGGRRVVRVRDAGDPMLAAVERLLAGSGDTLVVLEAAGLPARSRLRTALERAPSATVIACYREEGRQLATSLRAMVEREGCRIAADAATLLASMLGADRTATRAEIEKLVLYAGPGGLIDVEAVEACCPDASTLSLEHALFAATAGDLAGADRALERAIADGAAPVAIARALLGHLQRLGRVRARMQAEGTSAADATASARPPVFFRHAPAFAAALSRWDADTLARIGAETARVELACKQTGAPDALLCRHLVARIARAAAARTRA